MRTRTPKTLFLIALCSFLCSSLCMNISKAAAASKQPLTQADFKYIGAFQMPPSLPSGAETSFGRGLAYRYVNGELRMFSTTWNPQTIYEVRVPSPSLNAPYPTASFVRDWGSDWWGKSYTANGGATLFGLYWDEQDKRLYWSYGNEYNTQGGDDPSIGYMTLNDSAGSTTLVGIWRFSKGPKATLGCITPIPQWFSDAYTSGKRLGAGCGGPQSAISSGGVSMGPALTAFTPPDIATQPDRSTITGTDLVGYPFTDVVYGPPDRAHRDTNYQVDDSSWMGWVPKNGVGYWTDGDWLGQSGTWVDLPNKHGVMFFPTQVTGHFYYQSSTIWGGGAEHAWYVYDPADLAKVAQGQKQQWEIQPTWWSVQYPGLSYPLPSWNDMDPNLVTGVTFDPTTRRLYVAVLLAGSGGTYGVHKVYVYEVQSGSDSTIPAAPTRLRVR